MFVKAIWGARWGRKVMSGLSVGGCYVLVFFDAFIILGDNYGYISYTYDT